jgi:glyoxylase-like metal-dependent hydrolase (beta-lactamase superfamily II)
VAGFATHPDWDHALWHPEFGDVPRYGTARCAAALDDLLSKPDWRELMAPVMPDDAGEIPLELFGLITGLPPGAQQIPWDGPTIRIIEHQGHARGHAALVIEESRVLVAGDMLSDILIPFLETDAADPIGDYLCGLRLLESAADEVDVVIPGHGSVGRGEDVRARIALDRAYVEALRDGRVPDDPRVGPSATFGTDWLPGIHEWQAEQLLQTNG